MMSEQILEKYSHLQEIPKYLDKFKSPSSSKRMLRNGVVYDAYQDDIALVHIYWDTPSVLQFQRTLRLTWLDYLSQVKLGKV